MAGEELLFKDGSVSPPDGKRRILFLLIPSLILILFIADMAIGSVLISPRDLFGSLFGTADDITRTILLSFRLPKAVTAVVVGIALSVSGLQMQTLFRNPMAGPYVLGVSSGASLGVAVVVLGFSSIFSSGGSGAGNWTLLIAASIGSGLVMLLVFAVSLRVKDIMTILILGIMFASGISAVVSIMQYFSSESMLKAYVVWTMGSLGNLTMGQLYILVFTLCMGLIVVIATIKPLNALLLGENYATTMGLNIKKTRLLIFFSTSILAGGVTAFCGPIGFIGIAVPHITRLLFRSADHRILVPGSIGIGAIVMLLSDIISQLPGSDSILPINSVTSLIGIPVVIWVIMRGRNIER